MADIHIPTGPLRDITGRYVITPIRDARTGRNGAYRVADSHRVEPPRIMRTLDDVRRVVRLPQLPQQPTVVDMMRSGHPHMDLS